MSLSEVTLVDSSFVRREIKSYRDDFPEKDAGVDQGLWKFIVLVASVKRPKLKAEQWGAAEREKRSSEERQ